MRAGVSTSGFTQASSRATEESYAVPIYLQLGSREVTDNLPPYDRIHAE